MSNNRNSDFEKIKNFFKNSKNKDLCIKIENKKRYLLNKNIKIEFNKILGKSINSRDGEVYEIEILGKKIALKIVPYKISYSNTEINIMNQLNYLVLKGESPHFNLIYHNNDCNHEGNYVYKNTNIHGIVNEIDIMELYNDNINKIIYQLSKYSNVITDDKFNNFTAFPKSYQKLNHILKLIKNDSNTHLNNYKKYKKNSILIFSELSDIDLNTFLTNLKKNKDHTNLITSILKQIILALRILHLKEEIIHLDLHSGNVFLNKETTNGYWEYKSTKNNEPSVKIKNEGVQVRIADFGRSYSISKKNIDNISVYKHLYKQLKRFFPLHYSDDDINNFESFYKLINKKDINNWIVYFDIWRIFSSINNTINKNDITISNDLVTDINEILNISQIVLTTINFAIPYWDKNKNKNKKNIKNKEILKLSSVSAFNKSMYDNFSNDYIFNEKYNIKEKELSKLKQINKVKYILI
jgi:hypothetical protein